jgi:uncharacterized membrane protein YvbJ
VIVSLYSNVEDEIKNFLNKFDSDEKIESIDLKWQKKYTNPIEIVDIIGTFIDNNYKYKINMWISLDNDFFINVTDNNANQIIKYLFERFPY